MGMDLISTSDGEGFRFSHYGWESVLALAYDYGGWVPAGTQPPQFEGEPPWEGWSKTYCSNDRQVVTAEDARNLADALERALPDVPRKKTWPKKVVRAADGREFETMPEDLNPLERFSGPDGRRYLEGFIRFCRAGGFVIA
jgi:hypothetical protein